MLDGKIPAQEGTDPAHAVSRVVAHRREHLGGRTPPSSTPSASSRRAGSKQQARSPAPFRGFGGGSTLCSRAATSRRPRFLAVVHHVRHALRPRAPRRRTVGAAHNGEVPTSLPPSWCPDHDVEVDAVPREGSEGGMGLWPGGLGNGVRGLRQRTK